jgi:hypothetical protein
MKRTALLVFLTTTFAIFASAQPGAKQTPATPLAKADPDFEVLSKAAFAAHGGEKLKQLKTLVVRGSVDVTTSAMAQAIPGGFSTVISGHKYILDIQTPFQSIKQVYDGENTTSSIAGFTLPPVTSLGFPMLPRIGDKGFVVSALPETKKKSKGFRLTAPDGFYTDFFIDEKTSLIKGYESAYEVNGRTVTTSVAVDKNLVVDGITVPEKYSQRFDLGQLTAYSNFKAKQILVNSAIDDSVFSGGK